LLLLLQFENYCGLIQERCTEEEKEDGGEPTVKLEDCIRSYSVKEQLDESETWYCNKCKTHNRAFKQIRIWKAPKNMIVHLKRFVYKVSECEAKLRAKFRVPNSVRNFLFISYHGYINY